MNPKVVNQKNCDWFRWLTVSYLFALVSVGVLIVVGQLIDQWVLDNQISDATIINLSGRQRMLSQRISKLALLLIDDTIPPREKIARQNELRLAIDDWQAAHQGLRYGSEKLGLPGNNSDQITALFADIESAYQTILLSAQKLLDHPETMNRKTIYSTILDKEPIFINGMENIVSQYEREARERIRFLSQVELWLFLILLGVLVLEAVFIFRPVSLSIRDVLGEKETQQRQLEEALETSRNASNARSTFLANMSHEIRTPMNAVIGMTGLLLDTPLTAEQRTFVETIRTAGDSLLELINDILDFTKIESGKLDLEESTFELRVCAEEALDLLAPRAAEKGLDLAYIIADDVPTFIRSDVTRLRQILVNLLSNAVKFTSEGEVILRIGIRPSDEVSKADTSDSKLCRIHFSVQDTGIGIPEDRRGRLFQLFSQIDPSTTRRYGGTGLGLAISKRLVEMMGGEIWVESELDKGSNFHFTISAEVVDNVPAPRSQHVIPVLSGKRILVVDDNATNRQVLTLLLSKWELLVECVSSAASALARLRREPHPDVAILDLQMPDTDGLTLAEEIRKQFSPEQLPLIMLTSMGRREAEAGKLGFSAFLYKPIKQSQLYDALAMIFSGGQDPPDQSPKESSFDNSLAERSPLRILIAEDNAVNQRVILEILSRLGYRADAVGNGIEAVAAVQRQIYDVVLMDVQMPEMDGLQATKEIRKLEGITQPTIVAMTANVLKGDRERCLESGMNDFVGKPIKVTELIVALGRCSPIVVSESETVSEPATALDLQTLSNLGNIVGEDGLRHVVRLFLSDTPGLLARMRLGLEQNKIDEVRIAAHTLKSSSAALGGKDVARYCEELELACRADETQTLAARVACVDSAYPVLCRALEVQFFSESTA